MKEILRKSIFIKPYTTAKILGPTPRTILYGNDIVLIVETIEELQQKLTNWQQALQIKNEVFTLHPMKVTLHGTKPVTLANKGMPTYEVSRMHIVRAQNDEAGRRK